MTCGYCQTSNGKDDHRCRRCGRRLSGAVAPPPQHLAQETVRVEMRARGANALATAQVVESLPVEAVRKSAPREISMDAARTLDALPRPRIAGIQPSLFGAELQPKIIPFDTLPRTSTRSRVDAVAPTAKDENPPAPRTAARTTPRSTPRKSRAADEAQSTLDFLPPSKSASRTLKTSAEAVIYCDAMAAAPIHRTTAAALDSAMIVIGFGIVLTIFQFVAKPAGLNRNSFLMLGGMLVLSAMFYGLLFAISGALTPGMRWTELRLINFDGFPPDGRSRALRLVGCWISILSGGLGLAWAMLDEEGLTWHDHMSKTFPTLRESTSIVVRHKSR